MIGRTPSGTVEIQADSASCQDRYAHLVPFLFAGLASLSFGVADFFGGLATRRAAAFSVVLYSQLIGGIGILIAAPLLDPVADPTDFLWGAAAGVAGAVGIALLYQALATMRIGVIAPVTALVGTATPVIFGVAIGERPGLVAWFGIVVAVGAILLIASPPKDQEDLAPGGIRAVAVASIAGVAFGLFGIFISRTAVESGMWPLVGARVASIAVMVLAIVVLRRSFVPTGAQVPSAAAGLLDMAANVLFLLAVRRELLSLVTVIMAMYPASTVGLARVVFHERISRGQAVGLAIGALGVALIVLG